MLREPFGVLGYRSAELKRDSLNECSLFSRGEATTLTAFDAV
jgi:hypothetical protein